MGEEEHNRSQHMAKHDLLTECHEEGTCTREQDRMLDTVTEVVHHRVPSSWHSSLFTFLHLLTYLLACAVKITIRDDFQKIAVKN